MSHHSSSPPVTLGAGAALMLAATVALGARGSFDHEYEAWGRVLAAHVQGARVDYRTLTASRTALDDVVAGFDGPPTRAIAAWTRGQQLAFWINAYNAFTLQAIVDHYPIERRRFSLHPDNSIRQIPGVWNRRRWPAAGRMVTLDDIEHGILRPVFHEPRIHFAINCASIGCPPLAAEPYRAPTLDAQLDAATRMFLASQHGLQVERGLFRVSSLFKWYGEDFIGAFGAMVLGRRSIRDRAILGVLSKYAPADIADAAASGRVRVAFLPYDWSLNDTEETR